MLSAFAHRAPWQAAAERPDWFGAGAPGARALPELWLSGGWRGDPLPPGRGLAVGAWRYGESTFGTSAFTDHSAQAPIILIPLPTGAALGGAGLVGLGALVARTGRR